jgi:hypothetical protein
VYCNLFALTGEQQKRRATTAMNDRSSRAHSIFIMTLKQSHPHSTITLKSRLFLADLGGSEKIKKSGVDAGQVREGAAEQFSLGFELGQHMREAVNINLGLLALKKCIEGTLRTFFFFGGFYAMEYLVYSRVSLFFMHTSFRT